MCKRPSGCSQALSEPSTFTVKGYLGFVLPRSTGGEEFFVLTLDAAWVFVEVGAGFNFIQQQEHIDGLRALLPT